MMKMMKMMVVMLMKMAQIQLVPAAALETKGIRKHEGH